MMTVPSWGCPVDEAQGEDVGYCHTRSPCLGIGQAQAAACPFGRWRQTGLSQPGRLLRPLCGSGATGCSERAAPGFQETFWILSLIMARRASRACRQACPDRSGEVYNARCHNSVSSVDAVRFPTPGSGRMTRRLTELIAHAPWREAITCRETWPHEYILSERDAQQELLEAICDRFRAGGGCSLPLFPDE